MTFTDFLLVSGWKICPYLACKHWIGAILIKDDIMRRDEAYKGGLAEKLATHDLVVTRATDSVALPDFLTTRLLLANPLLEKICAGGWIGWTSPYIGNVSHETKNTVFVNSADFVSQVPFSMNFPEIIFNQNVPND